MIIDYSKSTSLCHAIAQTLDGAHPCSLCRIVEKAKTSEKKSDLELSTPKIDMICTKRAITLLPAFVYLEYLTADFSALKIVESPPVPPPRNSFVA
jgi:hypothetical protein